MEKKQRNIVLGCLAGCLIPVFLLIGSCVGFTAWLRAPGDLLEPQRLLDEQAVGYVEWRMELENPGTQRFFEAAVDLLDVQSRQMPSVPLLEIFQRWNQRRQERELRRLFPATGAWMVYPHGFTSKGESTDSDPARLGQLFSFSSARMSNQLRLMDWIGGLVLTRALGDATKVYRGERLYILGEGNGAGDGEGQESPVATAESLERDLGDVVVVEAPLTLHVFLRGEGVFASTESAVSLRAIDHLEEQLSPADRSSTRLERLFASVPEHFQMRGAVLNSNGELSELLDSMLFGWLELDAAQNEALIEALRRSRSAALGAGILADGSAEIEVVVDGPAELQGLLQDLGVQAIEKAAEEQFVLSSEVLAEERGVVWRLRFDDLVSSVERKVDDLVEGAMSEVGRERAREQPPERQ